MQAFGTHSDLSAVIYRAPTVAALGPSQHEGVLGRIVAAAIQTREAQCLSLY